MCLPKNSCVEALTLKCYLKMESLGGNLVEVMLVESSWWDWYSYKERQESTLSVSTMWGFSKKAGVCKAERETSPVSNYDCTQSDFQPPELWDITVIWATQSMIFCYGSLSRLTQSHMMFFVSFILIRHTYFLLIKSLYHYFF